MARILVADDEDMIRHLLKKFLEEQGHEVFTATDGEEALEQMKQVPEMVLLDIRMPKMHGLEVLDKVKEMAPSADVIMITGLKEHMVGMESFKRGAFDFVTKPIDLKHLKDLIDFKILQRTLEEEA